jgi:4-coumarate--CoA ligase
MRLTYVCLDRSALDNGGSPELRDILRRPETSVVISDVASCPAVDAAIANLHLAKNPLRICLESKSTFNGWKSLLDLAADGSATQIAEEDLVAEARNDDPNRVHSILFTSGTSGRPKGCPLRVGGMSHMLTSQSWLINKHNCTLALQQAHNSRGIAPAQTLQTWRDGGAVVMTGRGFAVDGVVDVIKRYGVTFVVLTPPMVHALGQQLAPGGLDVDVSSVRSVQVGGDAVTKDVLMRCAAIFPNAQVCVNHGMTEGGGQFEWPFMDAPTRSIPFYGEICPIGRVARGAVVRIWDADRQRVAKRGRPGELHLCCGSIIPQYHRGESESTFYSDEKGRWFRTGDIAMMDDDGLVFILGRSKDMIKRMGLAIMPAPLESCMEKFTGAQVSSTSTSLVHFIQPYRSTVVLTLIRYLAKTSVVPIPRQEGGYEPFSVLASLNCKTEEDIRNHVMRTLGAEYVLGGIVTLEQLGLSEFPVNPTHKIMKSELTDIVLSHLQAVTG